MLVEALSGAFVAEARPGLCTEAVVLRPLADGPVPVKELYLRARASKRATKSVLGAALRRGLVKERNGAVSLSTPVPDVEPASCPPLVALVSHFELDHPDFPITYGTADQSFTGGPGVDWKPVPRGVGDVSALPRSALLSQALVAFGIEYEQRKGGPIMWGASLTRGDHVSQSSGMERHGVIRGGKPTTLGVAMRDAYAPLCEQIEASWRGRFGSSLIDEVIDAVHVDGGYSTFPWVRWTRDEFVVLASGS